MEFEKFLPLAGHFSIDGSSYIFAEGQKDPANANNVFAGLSLCESDFDGGEITAEVEFSKLTGKEACQIVVSSQDSGSILVSAGLIAETKTGPMFCIATYKDRKWMLNNFGGDVGNLLPEVRYHLKAVVKGSYVSLLVNGVKVLSSVVNDISPRSQVGVFCKSEHKVIFHSFDIVSVEQAKAFVVMQFSSPFNEIHEDILKKVCIENKIQAFRADEKYSPGPILKDIEQQISEAKVVIADISESNDKFNANVFF